MKGQPWRGHGPRLRDSGGANAETTSVRDDVPAVRHLGRVVRHDHDLSDPDARLYGRPGWLGVLHGLHRVARLAVLRRPGRGSVLRDRTRDGVPLRRRRRAGLSRDDRHDVPGCLRADAGVLPVLLPDRRADELDHHAVAEGSGQGLPADSHARHAGLHRRRQRRQSAAVGSEREPVRVRRGGVGADGDLQPRRAAAHAAAGAWPAGHVAARGGPRHAQHDEAGHVRRLHHRVDSRVHPADVLLLVRERVPERPAGAERRLQDDARPVGGARSCCSSCRRCSASSASAACS